MVPFKCVYLQFISIDEIVFYVRIFCFITSPIAEDIVDLKH